VRRYATKPAATKSKHQIKKPKQLRRGIIGKRQDSLRAVRVAPGKTAFGVASIHAWVRRVNVVQVAVEPLVSLHPEILFTHHIRVAGAVLDVSHLDLAAHVDDFLKPETLT